jgi:hypothetical protein
LKSSAKNRACTLFLPPPFPPSFSHGTKSCPPRNPTTSF